MKKSSNIVWGVIFILVGLGIGGNILNIWNFNLFFSGWWTLFIIIPCVVSITQKGFNFGSLVGLCIGGIFLLGAQNVINVDRLWDLIVPIILVAIGGSFIFKRNYRNRIPDQMNSGYNGDPYMEQGHEGYYEQQQYNQEQNYQGNANAYYNGNPKMDISGVFSSRKVNYVNEVFGGCSLNAVFGGVTLDIRDAIIEHDVYIDATAVFGGIDILVPPDVKVMVNATPVFGGISNKARNPMGNIRAIIYVSGTSMFGGIDIK